MTSILHYLCFLTPTKSFYFSRPFTSMADIVKILTKQPRPINLEKNQILLFQIIWQRAIAGLSKKSAVCPAAAQKNHKSEKWFSPINPCPKVQPSLQPWSQANRRDIQDYVSSNFCQSQCYLLVILPNKSWRGRRGIRRSVGKDKYCDFDGFCRFSDLQLRVANKLLFFLRKIIRFALFASS